MRLFFLAVGQERSIFPRASGEDVSPENTEISKSIGYVLQNNVTDVQREASVMPIGRDRPLD